MSSSSKPEISRQDELRKRFGFDRDREKKLNNLLAVPKKEKGVNMPKTQVPMAGMVAQADLLFLPNDHGFKYLLVVVDLGSRLTDAEALRNKTGKAVANAFKKIFERKTIQKPRLMQVDPGGEFKGETKKYFDDEGIAVRYGKPGRHRQQSVVESRNKIIAQALFYRMSEIELLTERTSKLWRHDLKDVLEYINKALGKDVPETMEEFGKQGQRKTIPDTPVCKGDTCNLIPEGTKVRVIAEEPRDFVTGKKHKGPFRATDIRWEPEPREVERRILRPGFPPMYMIEGIDKVAYTKGQLQVVPEKEADPSRDSLQPGKPKKKKRRAS